MIVQSKNRELFHKYLLFKAGEYVLTYTTADGGVAKQTFLIDGKCRGCLGCYSCDNCAGCRPVPENWMDLKRIIGDYLLLGLALLSLACWPTLKRSR